MIQIPTFNPQESDWEQRITLGDQELRIRIQWNNRAGFWFMDCDDQQGHVICSRKLVPVIPIYRSHRALLPIAGDFVLLPESGASSEYPTFESLGSSHTLNWLNTDELVQWEESLGI
jgi:hypothetical protein